MAFSFNPGQTVQDSGQSGPNPDLVGLPITDIKPVGSPAQAGGDALPLSNSPFLFLQQRGRDFTTAAYLQIVLITVTGLSIFVSLILFIYSSYLSFRISGEKAALGSSEITFQVYPFDDMKKTSDRVAALSSILKDYVSMRSPLAFLESVVERQVVIDQFNLSRDDMANQYMIDFVAVTNNNNYNVLVQQLKALNLTEYKKITSSSKSGVTNTLDEKDSVTKLRITTPLFVSGMLPDNVETLLVTPSSSGNQITASTTP